jgi:O-antigen ligase
LFEKGEWQIDSNDKLKTMIVFPDNAKTWIIGDGYFSNPYYTDPYYVGYQLGGYYMGTDIGYCRFIFYFGIIGLIAFSFFFISVAKECISVMSENRTLILFVLLLGFVIWLKVATDVFLVFALLLCVGNMQEDNSLMQISE